MGRLLSEYPLPPPYVNYNENGCAQLTDVEGVLTTDNMPGSFTVDMAHERGLLIKRSEDLIVPTKIKQSRQANMWPPVKQDSSPHRLNAGRRLVAKRTAGISAALFPLLQSHIHELFKREHDVEVPLWKNGLRVALSENGVAEGIVQASEGLLAIDVIVRSDVTNEGGSRDLLRCLVQEVLKKGKELSPGSELKKCYLSPRHLADLSSEGSTDTTSCVVYSEEVVQRVLKSNGIVDDGQTALPEKVHDLLLSSTEATGWYKQNSFCPDN